MLRFQIVLAAVFLLSSLAVAAIKDPQQLIRETGDKVLAELTQRKADLDANPELIYPLVESTVVPHFDFREMSQSALGRFWRDASDVQKEGVTHEFRELLVRTYATALLGYTGQKIEYLPVQYNAGDTRVMIPTRVASAGAPPVPINYRLKLGDEGWMVYDVVIDGVSLITNYRSQFAAEVRRGGIDGLISTLAEKNRNVGK
ncbi:MAG: ABC transporter substrate-binding protein [Chromatiaceae bacterium]|nr:ABC transporter substrate-binding protein [Chromatiaceae bacterium]